MRRREFITLLGGAAVAWPLTARAQALPAVGLLPVAVLAATGGEPAVLAAKSATSAIPIVFAMSSDPIKLGLADSYNRPGRNATGMSLLTTTLEPKRLGLLHELVPSAAVIGILVNPNFPPSSGQVSDAREAANAIGVQIQVFGANDVRDFEIAFENMAKERIGAPGGGGLSVLRHLPQPDRGTGGSAPCTGNVPFSRVCGGWWSHQHRYRRSPSAGWGLCRTNSQRR
jgi:hypothetical protein